MVLKARTSGARPHAPPVALPHKAAMGGVVTLATVAPKTQLMVQGTPPRLTKRAGAGGKGVRGDATSRRWRAPERVAAREGGAGERRIEATMASKAARAKGQGNSSALLIHGDAVLTFKPCA